MLIAACCVLLHVLTPKHPEQGHQKKHISSWMVCPYLNLAKPPFRDAEVIADLRSQYIAPKFGVSNGHFLAFVPSRE